MSRRARRTKTSSESRKRKRKIAAEDNTTKCRPLVPSSPPASPPASPIRLKQRALSPQQQAAFDDDAHCCDLGNLISSIGTAAAAAAAVPTSEEGAILAVKTTAPNHSHAPEDNKYSGSNQHHHQHLQHRQEQHHKQQQQQDGNREHQLQRQRMRRLREKVYEEQQIQNAVLPGIGHHGQAQNDSPEKQTGVATYVGHVVTPRLRVECHLFWTRRCAWLVHVTCTFPLMLLLCGVSDLAFFACMMLAGYVYVAGVTCSRDNMLGDRFFTNWTKTNTSQREIVKLFLAIPFIYLMGPVATLHAAPQILPPWLQRHTADVEEADRDDLAANRPVIGPLWAASRLWWTNGIDADILSATAKMTAAGHPSPSSKGIFIAAYVWISDLFGGDLESSWASAWMPYLVQNYLCWVLPFCLGLHFTYLDYMTCLQCSCNARGIRYRRCAIAKVVVILCVPLLLVLWHIGHFWTENEIIAVVIGYGLLIGLVGTIAIVLVSIRGTHSMHLHHYQVALLLLPLTRVHGSVAGIVQGLLCGVAAEGAGRWGLAQFFKPHHPEGSVVVC